MRFLIVVNRKRLRVWRKKKERELLKVKKIYKGNKETFYMEMLSK